MLVQQVGEGNAVVGGWSEKIRDILRLIKEDLVGNPDHLEDCDKEILERI